MSICKVGKCEILNENVCCKKCEKLNYCIEQWSLECRGMKFKKYCLCTNFDSLKCEYEKLI